jgi:lipoprotein-anchoring transpeptidase ErfK/SrfK
VPAANAADVAPRAPVSVASPEGTLADLTLTAVGGAPVPGTLSPDKHRWTSTAPLAYGTAYTWAGSATAPGRSTTPVTGTFRTVAPAQQTRASINIGDGRTVGVAAPIAIQFDAPVADKAAVEKALRVTTSEPTEGSWAWLPDQDGGSRVHWRPKDYWKPGTKVDVHADLMGVPFGEGAWGREDLSTSFTIGRSQIVKADVNSFRMVVVRDGQEVMNVPASYGKDADPNRITRSGIHVVSEKFTDKRMVSQQYGYDTVEKWAVRMSNNGEFIHANPASAAAQGSSNVTHGCVNLSIGDAQTFYDSALYGDPVEVTNSGVALSPRDGDIYDWALSWDQWRAASALT